MWQSAQNAYLEARIDVADPIDLIRMLYGGAVSALKDARRHLAEGDISRRTRSISKAGEILAELAGSLDYANGGEISSRLARLYDYMQRRLTCANIEQTEAPLVEVLSLLATLSEAWNGIRP